MRHQVLRPFSAEGRTLQIGEIVETGEWRVRNVEVLERRRYLRAVFTPPPPEPPGMSSEPATNKQKGRSL